MENFLINKIEETIIKETQKQELKENIEKFLEIYTHEPLSILDKNNTNLLNSIFTKLIPDFQNNKSIKNAQEIYIAYKQNGTNGIEDYLIEVNVLLEYLKKHNIVRFTPIEVADKLKVTNRTIINWCAELVNNGYLKPILVNKRIRQYELI